MDDNIRQKAELDVARASEYQRAFDNLIEPFITKKNDELYQAFKSTPSGDTEALVLIKMQVNAMDSLKDEFQHHINTGKLASAALREDEENG